MMKSCAPLVPPLCFTLLLMDAERAALRTELSDAKARVAQLEAELSEQARRNNMLARFNQIALDRVTELTATNRKLRGENTSLHAEISVQHPYYMDKVRESFGLKEQLLVARNRLGPAGLKILAVAQAAGVGHPDENVRNPSWAHGKWNISYCRDEDAYHIDTEFDRRVATVHATLVAYWIVAVQ
ncbi:MAG: hypothetical protein ACREGB_01650, partial [Candidatus Saccharimonadales bacterium]